MGARKRLKAQEIKNEAKSKAFASLNDCPTSPRKMRLVVDLVRGKEVNRALDILRFTQKEAAKRVEKLLLSAISNWQNKNQGARIEEAGLFVKEIFVDSARILKRIRPGSRGMGRRIKKRSNHVTIILGSLNTNEN
jgi:large subunit ribosomal protein L22